MTSSPHRGGQPNLQGADVIRNQSALFRAQCKQLISESSKQCKDLQNDHNQKLDLRLKEVQFIKTELELKLDEIIVETDELITLQTRVAKALEATGEPLRVTNLCLEERMKLGPEMQQDEVGIELLSEREIIEGMASALQGLTEQITEQIRLNRSAKFTLEQDLKEKCEAQLVDSSCPVMTSHTISEQLSRTTTAAPQSSSVTPGQWENISDDNMTRAEQEKASSASLRVLVESVLEQASTDLQKRLHITTVFFQLNVKEIKSAKSWLEDQLAQILPELSDQRMIRDDLLAAISDSGEALSKAQAQLTLRSQRPSKELCRDPAETHLRSEVTKLHATISRLQKALALSEEKERALIRCQLELQKNISYKADCLYIDEVVCGQLREAVTASRF